MVTTMGTTTVRHLHDPELAATIRARLAALRPDARPQWGKMTVSQALAHLSAALEMATGDQKPPRMFAGRLFGGFVKRIVMRDDSPLKRNTPTSPGLLVQDDRDFERERRRLDSLIQRFSEGGESRCTTHPHTFFGAMTPREWAVLQYKHLDHHLRQFGA
jgi:hypothetical protein